MQQTSEIRSEVGSPTVHGTVVKHRRYLVGAAVILLLAALALLAAAMGGHHAGLVVSNRGGYSGDDAYDPATGARPELSVLVDMRAAEYGGN
jgi:hypothetical protein